VGGGLGRPRQRLTIADKEFCWIAPAVAGSATVSFTPSGGGAAKSFSMSVEAPTVRYKKVPGALPDEISGLSAGTAGAGMVLSVSFLPDTVSFQGLRWHESSAPATNLQGYFAGKMVQGHSPSSDPGKIGEDNGGVTDKAAYWNFEPPWKKGSFDWDIPTSYHVAGDQDRLIRNVTQTTNVQDASGCTTVTKDGDQTSDKRCP